MCTKFQNVNDKMQCLICLFKVDLKDGTKGIDSFRKMASVRSKNEHFTPLMVACSAYQRMCIPNSIINDEKAQVTLWSEAREMLLLLLDRLDTPLHYTYTETVRSKSFLLGVLQIYILNLFSSLDRLIDGLID